MIPKTIKNFIDEIYSKPPKKNYSRNKTDVYHIDDIWSLDNSDLKDYGPQNIKGYRHVLVAINNFSKFGWTIPIRNKKSIKINSFEKILIPSKRKPTLIKTDWGKEFYNIFQKFLNNNNIKHYSRKSYLGAVFAERFNLTIRNLLKRPVFERGDGNWVDILPAITKQYNNRIHSSTKLSQKQASLKK